MSVRYIYKSNRPKFWSVDDKLHRIGRVSTKNNDGVMKHCEII